MNTSFLSEVASKGEQYYQAARAEDLDTIYQSISESICVRGPAVIDVIPRTPDAFVGSGL